jgi:hypothetical protein
MSRTCIALARSSHVSRSVCASPAVDVLVPRGITTEAYEADAALGDWRAAVAHVTTEGWRYLELTAITPPLLDSLLRFLDDGGNSLDAFERVSLHAPAVGVDDPARILRRLPRQFDIVLHPNTYGEAAGVVELATRAVFENMDVAKSFGRNVDDLGRVFAQFPAAGFCLDVAHAWTNDHSLALGHELIDAFGGRLRQLHVSGIEPDGTHRVTTTRDLDLYEPLLDRCRGMPWLLETKLDADSR